MASTYNSTHTGAQIDAFDTSIQANLNNKANRSGDTFTGNVRIGSATDKTYRDLAVCRLGTNNVQQYMYLLNDANGTYGLVGRYNGSTQKSVLQFYDDKIVSPRNNFQVADGLLASTKNGNTVAIGSQTTGFCHFQNSANIPFYFNRGLQVDGDIVIYNGGSYGLKRVGISSAWYNGREKALVATTTANGYSTCISVKTTNGTWQIGHYNASGYHDQLLFDYVTDANYNSANNTSVKAKITAAGAFTSASKRELKENIVEFKDSAVDLIKSIKICSFNMKSDPNKDDRIGFIADDTHEIFAGKEHDIMDYQNCIGVLLKAVQELQAEIDDLKKQIQK